MLTLHGAVGPGFTISLHHGALHPGRVAIVVVDRSPIHDFHLEGPGVDRVITGVEFQGTKRVVVRLRRGVYTIVCDPHAGFMRSRFRVT